MDKGNKHPFSGNIMVFATKHEKEKILAPLFKQVGLSLIAADVDTDVLGTFSGEVERKGSIRETLREKINLALEQNPNARFFLASEGSFGVHPLLGFGSSNLESLLFYDRQSKSEIYSEFLSEDVCAAEIVLSAKQDYQSLLKSIDFPNTALIVHPAQSLTPIFKGIRTEADLQSAIHECSKVSPQVKISTDLRAHCNPKRQNVIYKAGEKLIELLNTFCPQCSYPGFAIISTVPGLICFGCKTPSRVTKDVVFGCPACKHEDIRARPDGLKFIETDECEVCNP